MNIARKRFGGAIKRGSYPYKWYVDSVNGNDQNGGRSPGNPFASIEKLLEVWESGQSVGLAKNSVWFEEIVVPGNDCALISYGSGDRPIIDCRDTLVNSDFSKTSGRTNIYEIQIVFRSSVTDANISVWENENVLRLVGSLGDCDSTPGSYYVASHTTSPQTLYVHATGSSVVTGDSKSYKYNSRALSIDAQLLSGVRIEGVHCIGNLAGAGSIACGSNAEIVDCVCRDGQKHSMYVGEGAKVTNCQFVDAFPQVSASASMLVINANSPNNGGAVVTGCTFKMSTLTTPGYNGVAAIYGHHNVSGNFGVLDIVDCEFENMLTIGLPTDVTTVNFTRPNCINCKYGFEGGVGVSTVNVVDAEWISNRTGQRFISSTTAGVCPINISGATVTFLAPTDTGYIYNTQECNISVIDSTFDITGADGWPKNLFNNTNSAFVLTSTGNRFVGSWQGTDYILYSSPEAGSFVFTSDNNRYDTFRIYYNDTVYPDLAGWQSATSNDISSTVG